VVQTASRLNHSGWDPNGKGDQSRLSCRLVPHLGGQGDVALTRRWQARRCHDPTWRPRLADTVARAGEVPEVTPRVAAGTRTTDARPTSMRAPVRTCALVLGQVIRVRISRRSGSLVPLRRETWIKRCHSRRRFGNIRTPRPHRDPDGHWKVDGLAHHTGRGGVNVRGEAICGTGCRLANP